MTKTKKLNKISYPLFSKRNGIDVVSIFIIIILMIFGIVVLFSASYPISYQLEDGDSFKYVKYQAVFFVVGLLALYLISFVDYHYLEKFSILVAVVSAVLLIIPLLLGGDEEGVKRWIPLGPVSFQPSEFSKFAFINFCAVIYSKNDYNKNKFVTAIIIPGILLACYAGLLLLEPHYSAIIILIIMFIIMMLVGEVKTSWFLIFLSLAVCGIVGLYMIAKSDTDIQFLNYFTDRLKGWTKALDENLSTDMYWKTWQTRNSMFAIGSGGLTGLGFGASRHKYQYMPAAQNDFVFSIACEELGFCGALFILALFIIFIGRCFYVSLKAPDKYGVVLGTGLSAMIGVQVIINIFVITDILPNTGISLPFFSYGGSFTLIFLAQLGVLLSISRSSKILH